MASPTEPAAVVINDEDREQAKIETRWKALMSFPRAPCFAQSVGLGVAGGTSIGVLRYFTSKQPVNALNWGAVVGGLLYGSTWFVCRRAMYKSIEEEAQLLSGVAQNDAEAIREYAKRVYERQQRKKEGA